VKNRLYFRDMRTFLIIVPEGGMLFEAAGIAKKMPREG
jgi:hypothetical protein